ncbi:MAG: LysR family transcriptional regulator [Azospirillum sp.]|nr:LysR family transcriptional regulator [Azospirillum sp.]
MSRFDDMIAFLRVVEAGSFTGAAERLGISKSAVSRRMTELEDRLGTRLLNRTTRRLSVTEAGRAFYQRCVGIAADLDDAERAAADLDRAPRGLLRIAAPLSFGVRHLAPALPEFLANHPALTIETDLSDRITDLVEEGFDVAIRIARLRDSSMIARRLAPCRLAVAASPAYLERFGRPRDPDALAEHNCLIYTNSPLSDQWQFEFDGTAQTVRVTGNLRANNGDILAKAAIAGLGITILPTFLLGEALNDGRLICLFADRLRPQLAVYAVYPPGRHLSSKVRVLIDFLAARFGPQPPWDDALPRPAPAS